jgi:hypothetical protein
MHRVRQWAVVGLAVALFTAGTANAQDIDLGFGGYEGVWRSTTAGAEAGFYLDLGALNSGDGRRDLVIGAPGKGEVYVVFSGPKRSGEINISSVDTILRSLEAGDRFGFATASGIVVSASSSQTRDLVIAAPKASGNRGAVYIFKGGFAGGNQVINADSTKYTAKIIGRAGEELGSSLATADLDGDGIREVVMGAPGVGRVYVVYGGAALTGDIDLNSPPGSVRVVTIIGNGLGQVLDAGDVTGDGRSEIMFGAPNTDTIYLLRGRSTAYPATLNFPADADAQFTGVDIGDRAGQSLANEDVDGDGVRDIIIGAPFGDGPTNGLPNSGEAYLLWGSASLASKSLSLADVTFYGAGEGWKFGQVVSVGHINRDAKNDLLFLAAGSIGGAGEVQVYYGRSRSQIGVLRPDGRRMLDFGVGGQYSRRVLGSPSVGVIRSVAAFEMTGEGARDIVLGMPTFDSSKGAVYVTLSPRMQLSRDNVTLTVPEGTSSSTTVTVENESPMVTTWRVTGGTTWTTLSPANGSSWWSSYGDITIGMSAAGRPPGADSTVVNRE